MSSCNVLQLSAKARTYVYDRYIENSRSKGAVTNYVDINNIGSHVKMVESM